ncbi:MAG: Hsp20/alpha crystallin family protein, partial [Lachnospiraceae bacterium]|nr:Hsp20/alpha crystallin family protein [Lachnospiraceae bacterium]
MKTDIRQTDQAYEIDIDIPGFKKDDISARLQDGYLTVSAEKNRNNDEKAEDGTYIRRERYSGSMSRSFYVGNGVRQEDIYAKFEDGILHLNVPKKDMETIQKQHYISIEG